MSPTRFAGTISISLVAVGAGSVSGQDTSTGSGQAFPNRPIRIVTSLPGGGSDFTARLIAQGISGPLGQPVIVENRPSNLTGDFAMKALPDGYTLLVEGNSFWYTPLIQPQRYDVLRDFTPVTIALNSPNIIVVHPAVPATSIRELIALAKAKPGQLNYGSSFGSTSHLGMAMLKSMAGIDIMHVFYKGGGPAVNAVIAGEVQFMSASAAAVAAFTKSGKLRALAVTSAKPSAMLPGLPTVGSTVPGYELELTTGLFASGKPSKAVISRLNQEIVRALNTKDIKEKFWNAGGETVGSTPEEFTASIKSDIGRMGKVIKDAGIKAE
jgi:tripartite-type tricarboxylate transporter receptor subunit TctC